MITKLRVVFFQYFDWQKSNPGERIGIVTLCVHLLICSTTLYQLFTDLNIEAELEMYARIILTENSGFTQFLPYNSRWFFKTGLAVADWPFSYHTCSYRSTLHNLHKFPIFNQEFIAATVTACRHFDRIQFNLFNFLYFPKIHLHLDLSLSCGRFPWDVTNSKQQNPSWEFFAAQQNAGFTFWIWLVPTFAKISRSVCMPNNL
jgi:hypothetical protein